MPKANERDFAIYYARVLLAQARIFRMRRNTRFHFRLLAMAGNARRKAASFRHDNDGDNMPIKAENKHRYPRNWKQIRAEILARAGHRCEFCGAMNKHLHPITRSRVVLTIAHLDHTPEHNDPANLRALCQRCHLAHDAEHHQQTAYETRRRPLALRDLFDANL